MPEVTNIEKPMMSRSVITGKSTTIHAQTNRKVLKGHVMKNHVIRPLHEGGINCKERLKALGGVSASKESGMLLGNAHVKVALGQLGFEGF